MMDEGIVSLFNKGPVLATDPLDKGEMALGNKVYAMERNVRAQGLRGSENAKQIVELYSVFRDAIGLKSLADRESELLGQTVECIVEEMATANNIFQVGSSILKGAAPLLMAIPGLGPMWGIGTYALGYSIGVINDIAHSNRNESLGQNRFNVYDNFGSEVNAESLKLISRMDDFESKAEKFQDYMLEIDDKLISIERSVTAHENKIHTMQFWGEIGNEDEFFVVIFLYMGIDKIHYIYINLSSNHSRYESVSTHKTDAIENVYNSMQSVSPRGFQKNKVLISNISLFVTDDILNDRVSKLGVNMKKFTGSKEDRRTAILLYLQLGLHVSRE